MDIEDDNHGHGEDVEEEAGEQRRAIVTAIETIVEAGAEVGAGVDQ